MGEKEIVYEALAKLITDTALAAHLGRTARQIVQATYSTEMVTQDYADLIRRVSTQSGLARVPSSFS